MEISSEITPENKPADVEGVVYYHTLETPAGGIVIASCSEELRFGDSPVALVSGGYDPVHEGHIASINAAAEFGPVVVIANSDGFLKRKRKDEATMVAPLLPLATRIAQLANFRYVLGVVVSVDEDQTVCKTIELLSEVESLTIGWFANGGDRMKTNTPEQSICDACGIEMLWSCGGDMKLANSSTVVKRTAVHAALCAVTPITPTRWGRYCTLAVSPSHVVKALHFNPGKGVSLQTHTKRSEEWLCVDGKGLLFLGLLSEAGRQVYGDDGQPVFGHAVPLVAGFSHKIINGQAHMNLNTGTAPLLIHETWTVDDGDPSDEEDIARFGDPFNNHHDIVRCANWLQGRRQLIAAE